MKRKQLRTWTPWEGDDDEPSLELPPLAPIRVTLVTSSGLPGQRRVEVVELENLRWGFELSLVPGPPEVQ
jgi:hypothetical protein